MISRKIQRTVPYLVNIIKRNSSNGNILRLKDRGFFQQVFPAELEQEIRTALGRQPQTLYAGFDPTADSLHIGNLLVIIGLIHCQRAGHQAIALLGGATGRIGDPSGKTNERNALGHDIVDHNLEQIGQQIERIFRNHEECLWKRRGQDEKFLVPLKVVNNANWYKNINFVNFISTVGRYFRMGAMLSRDSVKTRLESDSGMSFTEFTYQIFQAYDWYHLFKNHNCKFQIGGSDQFGNMKSGHDLISKMDNKQVYGLTLPLITTLEGDKFGKTAGNAVWLDPSKTSPYSMYQFFIRQPDSEVEKLLNLLTFLSHNEIKHIMAEHMKAPHLRDGQKKLAEEVMLLVHGENGLTRAEKITKAFYHGDIDEIGKMNENEIRSVFDGAPFCDIFVEPGITVLDAVMKAKCFAMEKDAIRIIKAGGFSINLNKTLNIDEVISPGIHIMPNGISLFRVGKRNYHIVKWVV